MLLLGLPLALFFAWAFEMTPEGIKREKNVDRSQSITGHTGKRLDYVKIVALELMLAIVAGERYLFPDTAPPAAVPDSSDCRRSSRSI